MSKLYHTTLKKNIDSIKEKGLLAKGLGIVYLSEKPDSWWQGEQNCTFEVNIKDIENKLTTFNEHDLDEVLCWGNIEPNRLKLLKNRDEEE